MSNNVHRRSPSLPIRITIGRGRRTGIAAATNDDVEGGRPRAVNTVVNASSSSPDIRLKSKLRSHRQRPAQKYIKTRHHEVSSSAVFWSLRLDLSALTHVREIHCCLVHVSNQLVVTHDLQIECTMCLMQTWTTGLPQLLDAWEAEGPHPGGYAGVHEGEVRHPGPAEYERDFALEPYTRRTLA